MKTVPAYELIGSEGRFRLVGGRTIYEAVCYLGASARSSRVRLARLVADERGLRQINRYVDWNAQIEVLP